MLAVKIVQHAERCAWRPGRPPRLSANVLPTARLAPNLKYPSSTTILILRQLSLQLPRYSLYYSTLTYFELYKMAPTEAVIAPPARPLHNRLPEGHIQGQSPLLHRRRKRYMQADGPCHSKLYAANIHFQALNILRPTRCRMAPQQPLSAASSTASKHPQKTSQMLPVASASLLKAMSDGLKI